VIQEDILLTCSKGNMIELISLFWIRKIFAKYMSNYMKIKNNFSGLQRKSSLDVE